MDNLFDLRGKYCLVTGGARGIGAMITEGLLNYNAEKVVVASRDEAALQKFSIEMNNRFGQNRCEYFKCDLSKESEIDVLVDHITKKFGVIHVLINNSGINWAAPLDTYDQLAFEKVLNVNVKKVFYLIQKVRLLPSIRKGSSQNDPGRIINIGSVDGIRVPLFETYAYSASKAALHQMTKVLAHHLASSNITVNAIAPGPFESKMMAATLKRYENEIIDSVPLKRIGKPGDIAAACVYLCGLGGSYVTGSILPVEGGLLIKAVL
ncbi:NAD(P)-binding protein [Rozella allomycis CSF55]|uniref:NAD(P)-binding protein n=1 Tax=Rozella allomycis (strain CSF55) TaxID=988480 RepID=A0A4P9YMZ5_ROZAC|nr:NAD(P)-binding protein [Rozella allomycis CSF55]